MNTEWTPAEGFGRIRACLHEPSEKSWYRLCEAMTLAEQHDPTSLYERWWPYIEEQLASWPPHIRACPLEWWEQPDELLHKWLSLGLIDDEVMSLFERPEPTGQYDGVHFFKYHVSDPQLDRFPVFMCTETPDWRSLPSWMWQRLLSLQLGINAIQEHFSEYGASHLPGDQGPRTGKAQWFVDSFLLDARQSPTWMTVYLIDLNWNVNGWPYGYWALKCDRMQVLSWESGKLIDD